MDFLVKYFFESCFYVSKNLLKINPLIGIYFYIIVFSFLFLSFLNIKNHPKITIIEIIEAKIIFDKIELFEKILSIILFS